MSKRFHMVLQTTSLLAVFPVIMILFQTTNAQIPTVDIPTVTGTPQGIVVTVKADEANPQINVRSGPGTEYDRVGTMVAGQKAVAKGRTEGGNWLLLEYSGGPGGFAWVYASYVNYIGDLPIVIVPNTPTPRVTNTIDPTLAAQFIITIEPTRLATYTAPAPLIIPTFPVAPGINVANSVPMGIIIFSCLIIGVLVGVVTLVQRR